MTERDLLELSDHRSSDAFSGSKMRLLNAAKYRPVARVVKSAVPVAKARMKSAVRRSTGRIIPQSGEPPVADRRRP